MYTILDVKNNLGGMLHGTTLDEVTNPNQVFERAARNLLSKIDPVDTIRTQQITNAVHSEVYNYTAPTDLKGKKVTDIRPQVNREQSDSFSQRFSKRFDLYKNRETFQIRYNKGVKTLRASFSILPSPLVLHECDSLTADGTWAADGTDASNLTADTLNYISGNASLNFDLLGIGTTGYLENSTMAAKDLTDYDEKGSIFARVYIPDASIITNFILSWGSSSAAYWASTVTTPYDQTAFQNGWNILRFNWNGATETGTVDPSAINYLKFLVTYDGTADTDIALDKISISTGEIWEIEYYSECLFSTSAGTWQTTTTEDTDIVNLDTDGFNLFLYECLLAISQQLQGADSGFDVGFSNSHLIELYRNYEFDHPSEAERPKSIYYDINLYNRRSR